MTNSRIKILEGLSGLSQRELRRFRQFLCSPYFSNSSRLPDLLDIILKCKEEGQEQNQWHRKVRSRFPGNATQLNRSFSALFNHLCQFLAWEKLNSDKELKQNLLRVEFRQRGYRKSLQQLKQASKNPRNGVPFSSTPDLISPDFPSRGAGDPLTRTTSASGIIEQACSRLDSYYRLQKSRLIFYDKLIGPGRTVPRMKTGQTCLPEEKAYHILTHLIDRSDQCPPALELSTLMSLSSELAPASAREVRLSALRICGEACLNGRETLANTVLKRYTSLHREGLLADPGDRSIPVVQLH